MAITAKGLSESPGTDSFERELFSLKGEIEKTKTLELEKENHKIDKELSVDEKLKKGWKQEKTTIYINGVEKNVSVLKKQIEGQKKDAFVREYMDDVVIPKHLIGEQLFNRYAVLNLGLEKRLPSYKQIETIMGGKENQKDGENMSPGYRSPTYERFNKVGERSSYWLLDGSHVNIDKDDMSHHYYGYDCGLSLRFIKN